MARLELQNLSKHYGPTVAVRELDAVRQLVSGRPSGFCELGGHCVGTFIAIEADGRVTHCDKYTGDPDYEFGNLLTQSLKHLLSGDRAHAIARRATAGMPQSQVCRHHALCQGGCPHERYMRAGPRTRGCCGLAPLFEFYEAQPREPDLDRDRQAIAGPQEQP